MKKLRLKALYLISRTEKKAKKVPFHPHVTVIKGANDTGKSSIIKSIYWCFGADPAVENRRWKAINPVGLLEFSIDEEDYSILRYGNSFAVFDAGGKILLKTTSITKGLAPFFAPLLNFGLYLTNRDGSPETPPLAYCFIPFYVDQDMSWQTQWKSFKHLSQYSDWKKSVILYHSGIQPNAYFQIRAEMAQEERKLDELNGEMRSVNAALQRLKERSRINTIELDKSAYKHAVAELLRELTALQDRRLTSLARLAEMTNQKVLLEEQISIAKNALSEFEKDYKFIKDSNSEEILCPTCGTAHENSFSHRFSLIEDREACRDFLLASTKRSEKIDADIKISNAKLGQENYRIVKINALLQQKRSKLKLGDVIDAEGEKRAYQIMFSELEKVKNEISRQRNTIHHLERHIKEYTNSERRGEIQKFYETKMNKFANELNLSASYPGRIDYVIGETGNDRPRAILAYFYAFIHTLQEYSTACFCPIVIDSPKQQDPDDENIMAAFGLIFSHKPRDAQLIVGTVSLPDIHHGGSEIILLDKYHLLQESEYEEVNEHIRAKLDAMFSH